MIILNESLNNPGKTNNLWYQLQVQKSSRSYRCVVRSLGKGRHNASTRGSIKEQE